MSKKKFEDVDSTLWHARYEGYRSGSEETITPLICTRCGASVINNSWVVDVHNRWHDDQG